MDWFAPIRALMLHNLSALRWVVPAVTAAAALVLLLWRRAAAVKAAFLLVCLGLAVWGQVFLGRREWLYAAALYAAAALLFLIWLLVLRGEPCCVGCADEETRRRVDKETRKQGDKVAGVAKAPSFPSSLSTCLPVYLSPRREMALALLIVLVAAFARYTRFDKVPYGIEGDEAKWSVQIAAEVFAGQHRWDSDYRYKYVPFTYWVESLFYRLKGISFQTARWQVAFLSVIATALFYLLARRILGPPGALIAAFMLAVSIPDISASRLSHVEAQIKLPLMVSFLGLASAVATRRWYWYLVTGLGVAAGLLTFDTFFFVPVVVGLWLAWRFVADRQVRWRDKFGHLLLFAAPVAIVAPNAWFYISTRRGDHLKSGTALAGKAAGSLAALWPQLRENLIQTLSNFSYQRWGDYLVNRDGPIVNAALIPLAALGLVYLTVRWRRGQNGLVPLWFLLLFFPAAVFFGSPYARVFYPAIPALYLLAAAAVLLLVRTLSSLGAPAGAFRKGIAAAALLGLAFLGVNNIYTYLHEIKDFPERITRRQMADAVAVQLAAGQKVYVPYMPRYDDFVEWDREFLQYVVWGKAPVGQESQYYSLLSYDALLPALSVEGPRLPEPRSAAGEQRSAATQPLPASQAPQSSQEPAAFTSPLRIPAASGGRGGATVLYDRGNSTLRSERQKVIDAVLRCYPGTRVEAGTRFDSIVIPASAFAAPACTAAVTVTAQAPVGQPPPVGANGRSSLLAGQALTLTWTTQPPGSGTAATVEIARQVPNVTWLEAEDLFHAAGWYVEGRFGPGFSGSGYLADVFNAPDATVQVPLAAPGRYAVWVRTHRRITRDMPLTVKVGGATFPAAQHSPDQFDQWRWEKLGEVDLQGAAVPVTLHRDYASGGRHMSVFLDVLVLSRELSFEPANGMWPVAYRSPAVPADDGRFEVHPAGTSPSAAAAAVAPEQPPLPPGARRFPVQVVTEGGLIDAVLAVDDPKFNIDDQDAWRILPRRTSAVPGAEVALGPGRYRWRVQVSDGDRIVASDGTVGQWSNWTEFTLR